MECMTAGNDSERTAEKVKTDVWQVLAEEPRDDSLGNKIITVL